MSVYVIERYGRDMAQAFTEYLYVPIHTSKQYDWTFLYTAAKKFYSYEAAIEEAQLVNIYFGEFGACVVIREDIDMGQFISGMMLV